MNRLGMSVALVLSLVAGCVATDQPPPTETGTSSQDLTTTTTTTTTVTLSDGPSGARWRTYHAPASAKAPTSTPAAILPNGNRCKSLTTGIREIAERLPLCVAQAEPNSLAV